MCVIIIKQKDKKIKKETLKTSAKINPHGLGIVWLDTFQVTYHKSNEYAVLYTERPFIAHFRYATIGKVNKENTHPFRCGLKTDEYLMMNGTISGLGNAQTCDTKVLAKQLGHIPRHKWKETLAEHKEVRFVSVNTRTRSFQIYNRHLYTYKNGIWYSKDNVLQDNLIAVYGTLKKNHSNYYHYLRRAKYLGGGTTKDKYPMIIDSLPYVLKHKGKGHNVEVDVFKVCSTDLDSVDQLEGHPNWYFREEVDIKMKSGKILKCWLYFNKKDYKEGAQTHKTYKQNTYSGSWYKRGRFGDLHSMVSQTKKVSNPARQELNFQWDDVEIWDTECATLNDSVSEEYFCPTCYGNVKYDDFNNYRCDTCDEWFTDREIMRDQM